MSSRFLSIILFLGFASFVFVETSCAEDLYKGSKWADLASDNKAENLGDVLTVIVFQAADARNSAQSNTRSRSSFDAEVGSGGFRRGGDLSLGSAFQGAGDVRRSESLITQFSVEIIGEYPNGDLLIAGEQDMFVNGEASSIAIQGRIRAVDVTANNTVLSTQVANVEINYNGSGYVSRSSRPGFLSTIFGFFGL